VSVVSVVLDSPGLKRIHERHEHDCSYNVVDKLALRERVVPTVMANNKQTRHGSSQVGIN
jgi:hypothetical protein